MSHQVSISIPYALRTILGFFGKILKLEALGLGNTVPRLPALNGLRIALPRLAWMRIAKGVVIWGPVTAVPLEGLRNISIGARSFLNTETRFGYPNAQIQIGVDVQS